MANPGMRHAYKSTKSDPVDTTLIGATKWNDRHYMLEDDGTTASGAQGDLMYRGTAGLVTLLTGAQGVLTSAGSGNTPAWSMSPTLTSPTVTTIIIGAVTIDATDAGYIDGLTPGTVTASKALVVDANRDLASLRNVTLTGTLVTGSFVQIGGATSSFPGLKRSSAALHVRLADDSDYAELQAMRVGANHATGIQYYFGGTSSSFPGMKRSGANLELKLADDSGFTNLRAETLLVNTSVRLNPAVSAVDILFGAGDPNGVKTANPGSIYMNTSGGAGVSVYVKESGSGNTGWVAK